METSSAVLAANETQTRKHHRYGPSKLNYLDACAGYTSKEGISDAAEQGTFLHDLMEKMLQNVIQKKAKTTLEQVSGWVAKSIELTDEERDYLCFCCKRCDTFIGKNPTAIHTEISVSVKHEDGGELNHGYLDVLFIFGDVGILQDFKFGWVPVKPASENLQGFAYVLGCFQKFRQLNRIGCEFVQPKLNWVSNQVFERKAMFDLYKRLNGVIERAEYVQTQPADAQKYLKPGDYCTYCAKAGSCAVLANYRGMAVSRIKGIPLPVSFVGTELTKPEDVALARYWVDIVETGLKEVKSRAMEIAEANGGEIRCTLPSGEEVVYAIQERNADRCLSSAPEVADALKEFVSSQEILGAAELAITKLEPIAKNALVELAKARGEKLTKKAAWEQVQSTLEAQGLLSRPDTKIRFLKLQKRAVKQISNS